jgi:hypothetical protein
MMAMMTTVKNPLPIVQKHKIRVVFMFRPLAFQQGLFYAMKSIFRLSTHILACSQVYLGVRLGVLRDRGRCT